VQEARRDARRSHPCASRNERARHDVPPRTLPREELDADALFWDMRRRVRMDLLPTAPVVARFELSDVHGRAGLRFLLLRHTEVSLCGEKDTRSASNENFAT
jgi:hypothetical protein